MTAPERLADAPASTFSRRGARWLVGVGIVSLVATLLLSVLSKSGEPEEATADANAFSYSAIGHRAFVALLANMDLDVTVSRHRSLEKASATRPLFLLEPRSGYDENRIVEMIAKASKGATPVVIALPKWQAVDYSDDKTWAERIGILGTETVDGALAQIVGALHPDGEVGEPLSIARDLPPRGPVSMGGAATRWSIAAEEAQLIVPNEALDPVFTVPTDEGERVLVARFPDTRIYLVSDPDLLNTMGIGKADHAELAVSLVLDVLHADGVVIDEVSHGFEKASTLWQELFAFPLVLVTLHLIGLLGFALWAAMSRFGKPETRPPRVPSGKQTLLDNTATLLALGHHAGHGVKRYLEANLRAVARAYGLPAEASDEARLDAIAALAARRGVDKKSGLDIRVLARDAAALAQRDGRRADERKARELAKRIHQFRTEMRDGHRSDS